ncbi:MAG: hypothetical protein U0230_21135 [Polyangiales bacterium]
MSRALLLASFLVTVPSTLRAEDAPSPEPNASRRTTVALLGGTAFGGRDRLTVSPPILPTIATTTDPSLSPGFVLRGDESLHPSFSIGASFGLERARSQGSAPTTNLLDFDLSLRLHTDAGHVGETSFQAYVVAPGGMTLEVMPDTPSYGGDRLRLGWNAGALLGLSLVTSSGVGAMLEGGYTWRKTYDQGTAGTEATHERSGAVVRAGLVFAF